MRSNPSGLLGALTDTVKAALPVAVSLYLSRVVSAQLSMRIPQIGGMGRFGAPVVAAATLLGTHLLTSKVGALRPYRSGALLGAGINLVDKLVGAFAPDSIRSMFGLSGDEFGDYVQGTGEYGGNELSDYVGTGDVDDELSGLQDELGSGFAHSGNDLGTSLQTGIFARA